MCPVFYLLILEKEQTDELRQSTSVGWDLPHIDPWSHEVLSTTCLPGIAPLLKPQAMNLAGSWTLALDVAAAPCLTVDSLTPDFMQRPSSILWPGGIAPVNSPARNNGAATISRSRSGRQTSTGKPLLFIIRHQVLNFHRTAIRLVSPALP